MRGTPWIALAGTLALAGCDLVFGIPEVAPDTRPRLLTFDNGASASDLVNFPVMVPLDAGEVGLVGDPTMELRFHDPETDADLPFEVEVWDPTGESLVWVRVPTIHAGSRTDHISMYVGPDAAGSEQPQAVWSDYDLVLHADSDLHNAAATGHDGTAIGTTLGDGVIGGAVRMSGTGDQRVSFAQGNALLNAWGTFTLELWLDPTYPSLAFCKQTQPPEPYFVDEGGSIALGRLLCASANGPLLGQLDIHVAGDASYMQTYIPTNTWTHLMWSFDGQLLWLYRNGNFADLDAFAAVTKLASSSGSFHLGSSSGGIAGGIDEVRVSQQFRNPDWAYASYLTMTRRFVSSSVSP